MIATQSPLKAIRDLCLPTVVRRRPLISTLVALMLGGCHWQSDVKFSDSYSNYRPVVAEIEYPDAHIGYRNLRTARFR